MATKAKATQKPTIATAEKVSVSETAREEAMRRYTIERLRGDCLVLFGITTSTFDAAMCGVNEGDGLTIDEAKRCIKEWMKKGVM